MASMPQVGDTAWVRYRVGGAALWHQRLLLASVGELSENEWVSATPDGDVYAEVLDDALNPDVAGVVFQVKGSPHPREVPRNSIYRFARVPSLNEMKELKEFNRLS